MSQDEAGTLRALTAAREIMDGLISAHGGRIANTAGDSVLAEFPSAVDAVQCAVAVQEKLGGTKDGAADDRPFQFRIGVHLGDVAVRGGDLLGDGVNIAARLEGLAEAGGVCLSEAVHGFVRKVLPLAYTDLGEQAVKGIDEPVRAYAVKPTAAPQIVTSEPKPLPLPDRPSPPQHAGDASPVSCWLAHVNAYHDRQPTALTGDVALTGSGSRRT